VKIWNNIPSNVSELGKKNFSNKVLHKSLSTILGLEDDYVDVPTVC
jgi:hypothetical protein